MGKALGVFLAGLLLLSPSVVHAQAASLVADAVSVEGETRLIARGNVEVFFEDSVLRAEAVTYDQSTGRLTITGPLRLSQGSSTLLLADRADLTQDLRNGLLSSARLVLEGQLQLAATEIARIEGRYTELYQVAATSCQVCASDEPPLWQIRAKRVLHDTEEQQLYFERAQIRILDVPVLFLPRMRLPDPSLDRATGFLLPRWRTTSQLGFGIKVPYFIKLGDHRDLTLTPYVSPETRTLEFRYRQSLANGDLAFEGALTSDDILPDETRGYLFAAGAFELRNAYRLTFDIEVTTDDAYLLDYSYSSKDRLDSAIGLTRTQNRRDFSTEVVYFESLREGEANRTLPPLVFDIRDSRRSQKDRLGGYWDVVYGAHGHKRNENADITGRDVFRAEAAAHYQNRYVFDNGITSRSFAGARADIYDVNQDSRFDDETRLRVVPSVSTELSWPLARVGQAGGIHSLTPTLQITWREILGDDVPNDDSTRVEFDEANLFALARAPGADIQEDGIRGTFGLSYGFATRDGWALKVAGGRSFANERTRGFSDTSGLDGDQSDWLATFQVTHASGFQFINRAVFDDDFTFAKNEARAWWSGPRWDLASSFIFMVEDAQEDRDEAVSELTADGRYRLSSSWEAEADIRYDFITDRAASAGLGLTYANECVEVKLSLSRRFTSSTTVSPTTDFDLSVGLKGFSTGRAASRLKQAHCRR